jgi:hypothetical protein
LLVGLALAAHAGLQHALAGTSASAALLSPSPEAPWALLQVGLFVLLRLGLFFVLPGLVLARLLRAAAAALASRRDRPGAT